MDGLLSFALIFGITIGMAGQSICKKEYIRRDENGNIAFFNILTIGATFLTFLVLNKFSLVFHLNTLLMAMIFAVGYSAAVICGTMAVQCGALSLTSLVTAYSLIIPTVWGIIFLNEGFGIIKALGLAALVVSLFLINYQKDAEIKITPKWLILAVLAFVGNGVASTMVKLHQMAFPGEYGGEFMCYGIGMSFLISIVVFLFSNRENAKRCFKLGWHFASAQGVMNALVNAGVVYGSNIMAASLMFPLISAGNIIVVLGISMLIYREKLTKVQLFGFIFGLAAIVLLNL